MPAGTFAQREPLTTINVGVPPRRIIGGTSTSTGVGSHEPAIAHSDRPQPRCCAPRVFAVLVAPARDRPFVRRFHAWLPELLDSNHRQARAAARHGCGGD